MSTTITMPPHCGCNPAFAPPYENSLKKPCAGFISGELSISVALDAFLTVFELPLTHLKADRQTNKQRHTDVNDDYTSLMLPPPMHTRNHHPVVVTVTTKCINTSNTPPHNYVGGDVHHLRNSSIEPRLYVHAPPPKQLVKVAAHCNWNALS